jgi:hypothetical protein
VCTCSLGACGALAGSSQLSTLQVLQCTLRIWCCAAQEQALHEADDFVLLKTADMYQAMVHAEGSLPCAADMSLITQTWSHPASIRAVFNIIDLHP